MHNSPLPFSCQAMLHMVLQHCGIDFTHYQTGSLLRRINLRMTQVGIADYAAYADYLASTPDECDHLVNTILINQTTFFRDPDVWSALANDVVPQILARKSATAPLRIWSAGCATGQEPYSLAMLLAELLGLERVANSVTIYATDVDVDALGLVRQARYLPWSVRMAPSVLLDRYFVRDDMHHVVREELRRAVVVQRHNLLTDAPLPQIDLLLCRNVLIYLNSAAQKRVVRQLRGVLGDNSALVLGKTEMVLPASHGLRWLSKQHRIVAKALDGIGATTRYRQLGDWEYV